jgi:hypothetical protein
MCPAARRVAVSGSRTELSQSAGRAEASAFAGPERHDLGAMSVLAVEEGARGGASALLSRRAEMKTGRRRCLHPAPDPLWVTA